MECCKKKTDSEFDFNLQIKVSNNLEGLNDTLPDCKSLKKLEEIWLYNVLLCKSERKSDFDIVGCESETMRLAICLFDA